MSKSDEQAQPVKSKVQMGDLAPEFRLLNQSGIPVNLGDFLGQQPLVLYFFPRDNTAICTEELSCFRDSYDGMKRVGVGRGAVFSHSVEEQRQFVNQHHLP